MMRNFGAIAALILIGGTAAANTIDFESYSIGTELAGVDLGGVTLTRGDERIVVIGEFPSNGSLRAIFGVPFISDNGYRADFSGTVDAFSVDLGDFANDQDLLYVEAYSATDVLLDSDTFDFPISRVGLQILSVSAQGIDYVLFGSTGFANNSVFADNLTFNPEILPIPEPSSVMLFAAGMFVVVRAVRNRGQG